MTPRDITSELKRMGYGLPLPDQHVLDLLKDRALQSSATDTLKYAQQDADAAFLKALGIQPL